MSGATRWAACPALSRPLTVLGVERTWFALAATFAVALFQILQTLLPPLTAFALLYLAGRWAGRADPRLLAVLAAARRCRPRYDPAKPGRDGA